MIYLFIGPAGSGKSTLARNMARFLNVVIVGRDHLREMLFGYTPETINAYYSLESLRKDEKIITAYQDTIIKKALNDGKHVFVDNTNLDIKIIEDFKKFNVPLKFILVETDLETAIERDRLRARTVGEDIIKKQFEKLEHLKKTFDFKDWTPEPVGGLLGQNHNPANGSVWVFDIDGTLALNTSGRSPFDYASVGKDSVNEPVRKTLEALDATGYDIILCSGREEAFREQTVDWLLDNGITFGSLYMRPTKDFRKDYIVKEEMWRDILKYHNIIAMFDDRTQVVEHARKLGFTVFQVAEGNF